MYANRLTDFLQYLFGFRRRLALQPVRVRLLLGAAVIPAVLTFAQSATASVLATGNFTPADNPFTLNINEGMPTDGNFANPFELINAQTFFEGRHVDNNINDLTDDNNINFDIKVGITSSGSMLISGESALRDQDLVIGDSGTLNGQTRFGTGVVRITGFGSLYNNDPFILPAEVEAAGTAFKSKTPRDTDKGFDLLVGYKGSGTLEITAGTRAEIQDAVAVGDQPGAVGSLVVDGIDSFLGNGGFPVTGGGGGTGGGTGSRTTFHQMIIGRQGIGAMTISAGATVDSEGPPSIAAANGIGSVGAVLGSSPYTGTLGQVPDPGGNGTATVTGASSKWIIGGSLQIGGFDIGLATGNTLGSIEGAPPETHYNSQAGSGTLYVNDGALVDVRNALGAITTGGGQDTSLIVGIGRFGVLQLNGGTVNVGNLTGTDTQASTPDTVEFINDGVIRGSGRINTGVFRNRYLGQLRVDAGQSLVVTSTAQHVTTGGATPSEPLVNYGSIQVLGTVQAQASLEFVRAPSDPLNVSPVRPFFNLPLSTAPTQPAFTGGQISAQYATLRFGSGLENHSMLAFTAGTSNVIGRVVNVGLDTLNPSGDDSDGGDTAQLLVSGQSTTAVFHDDLAFGPQADLNLVDGGKLVVLNQHSFTMAGNLAIQLSYAHPSLITVGGDVGIGPAGANNDLSVSIGSDVLHTLKHGDAFQIIAFTGDIGGVTLAAPNNPTVNYAVAPQFTDVDFDPNVSILPLVPQVQFANQGVYVVFLNPALVGPTPGGAVAPDFNGDGVINLLDYAIWNAHKGQMSGASVLDGDADGDGDVDGADFLKWQRNVGKPGPPWPGAGSGSGNIALSTIPEPTSLMLLACGGSLALAFGRRRSKR